MRYTIVGDPEAFEYDIDGTPTRAERHRLVGAELVGRRRMAEQILVSPHELFPGVDEPLELLLLSSPYAIKPAPGTVTLGTYDDGSPAMTLRQHGEGRILYFAASPFTAPTLAATDWQEFFGRLQRGLGFSTGLDIWRFKFPPFETVDLPKPQGLCLTNNHVEWREEQQHPLQNVDTGGTYTLSPPPSGSAELEKPLATAIGEGRLTDRMNWPELEKVKAAGYQSYTEPLAEWVAAWEAPGEVAVTFDFQTPRPLLRAHIWYSGAFDEVKLAGSTDGNTWTEIGSATGGAAGKDVLDAAVTGNAYRGRYARLTFMRSATAPLTLAEMEIWAAEQ